MNIESWKQAWEVNNIGFHKNTAHPLLVKYFKELGLEKNSRLFLPLCGKTLDIAWLLSQGYRVAGAEVSQLAVEQLFLELGLEAKIEGSGKLFRYSAINIDLFVGDVFDLSREILGPVDAVYDRAALVALPETMRKLYTKLLLKISGEAQQLLITFEYYQSLKSGPPFSIDSLEINQHYNDAYDLKLLESITLPGGLKGTLVATENIWLLKK